MNYEDEIGALAPTGFWDPLGLSKGIDEATFTKYRTAELKHGRVAMLAVVGLIVAENTRLPGTIDLDGTTFASIPNGLDAFSAISPFGWFQIAASVGFWEIFGWKQVEGSTPGDFDYGATFIEGKALSEDKLREFKTKELQNGRLAMIGAAELLTHDFATNENLFVLHHF